ncbi:hypothetical protein G6F54_014507 [Rhizopus delemar]|nr:hypothetical protein G6F54_014507 [Rhizopus delemar]
MAGNENDGELRIDIAQAVEQLQAIDIGHANVRHDDPVEFPFQGLNVCPPQFLIGVDEDDVRLGGLA